MRKARVPEGSINDLTDTHCHLEAKEFADDLTDVLCRAAAAGIVRMLIPGTDLPGSRTAAELAAAIPQAWFSAGIHPHDSRLYSSGAESELRELLRRPNIAAVGEIGLDYYRDLSPRNVQQAAFQSQLELARLFHLPVIVHIRDAAEDAIAILSESGGQPGVLHAFSGEMWVMEKAVELGMYFGAGGAMTYPNASRVREVFRSIPSDRLLLETDSPYLPPEGHRGSRNEPALVRLTAHRLAQERKTGVRALVSECRSNANALFRWE